VYFCTMKLIQINIQRIIELCQQFHVAKLFAFGSILTERFTAHSDVDLLVEFKEIPIENYADNYLSLKVALSDLLNRSIDLIEAKGIRNRVFLSNVERTKQLIYG